MEEFAQLIDQEFIEERIPFQVFDETLVEFSDGTCSIWLDAMK